MRFVDENAQITSPEVGGELHLKMPENMRPRNYPDMAPLCDADGWTSTGDIGRINDDGELILSGRKTDLINSGGNKRAPEVFERMLAASEGISHVAAFKIPTDIGIDDVGIAVVLDEGFGTDGLTDELASKTDGVYVFRLVVLDTIPLTPAGQPDRIKLLEIYEDQTA